MTSRYSHYFDNSATWLDGLVLVIWMCVVLGPLFMEVSFLGVTLKAQVESVKSEVKDHE